MQFKICNENHAHSTTAHKSQIALFQILLIRRHGQGVAAFVFRVAAVAADVGEADLVAAEQFVEPPPEVFVLDLFAAACLRGAASRWPSTWAAIRSALADVDAVGDQFDRGRAFERFQAADHGRQFHAVVGGFAFAARSFQFFARVGMPQDKGPAARPRIAAARAVGEELDFVSSGSFGWSHNL